MNSLHLGKPFGSFPKTRQVNRRDQLTMWKCAYHSVKDIHAAFAFPNRACTHVTWFICQWCRTASTVTSKQLTLVCCHGNGTLRQLCLTLRHFFSISSIKSLHASCHMVSCHDCSTTRRLSQDRLVIFTLCFFHWNHKIHGVNCV